MGRFWSPTSSEIRPICLLKLSPPPVVLYLVFNESSFVCARAGRSSCGFSEITDNIGKFIFTVVVKVRQNIVLSAFTSQKRDNPVKQNNN